MLPNQGVLTARAQSIATRDLFDAIRIHQWIKNLVVPLVAVAMLDTANAAAANPGASALRIGLAFAAFCLAASAVYILNDILDIPKDRLHPSKRLRPIASGRIGCAFLCGLLAGFGPAALFLAWLASPKVMAVVALYLALNVAYCIRLKHVAPLDIVCIGAGFTLRALAGAYAVGSAVNFWMLATVTFACMGLAVMKRMKELKAFGALAATRPVLASYNYDTLLRAHDIFMTLALQALLMFIEQASHRFSQQISVAAVLLLVAGAFLLFMQHVDRDGEGDPTALVYRYRFSALLLVALYLALFLLR